MDGPTGQLQVDPAEYRETEIDIDDEERGTSGDNGDKAKKKLFSSGVRLPRRGEPAYGTLEETSTDDFESRRAGAEDHSGSENDNEDVSDQPTSRPQAAMPIKWVPVALAIVAFLILYFVPVLPDQPAAHKAAALLVAVGILWATEGLPLFVTSLLVPLPAVWLGMLLDIDNPSIRLDPVTAAKRISDSMFDPIILLFLGGFTIAQAMDQYHINRRLSSWVLGKAGRKPRVVLLTIMGLGAFLSMWISNVAAAVLCVATVMPIVHKLPTSDPFRQCLLLGIAFSCNVGGMGSPIASPQNAIGMSAINHALGHGITFVQWVGVAVPVVSALVVIFWLVLSTLFRPACREVPLLPPSEHTMGPRQWYIVSVVVVTVALWCLSSLLDPIFAGHMGITALIPVVCFFGPGLLSQRDFEQLPWAVLMLMAGGLALGHVVESSQLLELMSNGVGALVEDSTEWVAIFIFMAFVMLMSIFVSNAVAAIIVLPVVARIGVEMGEGKIMVLLGALMCSGGQALPMSSFPNANSFAVEDHVGEPVLKVRSFVLSGSLMSALAYAGVCTIGYGMAKAIQLVDTNS